MKSNLIWQFLGQSLGKVFTLCFYILLPRQLGLEEYGKFAFILSIGLISFQPFVDLGLDIQLTKWVSRNLFSVTQRVRYLRLTIGIILIAVNLFIAQFFQIDLLVFFTILIYLLILSWQNTYFALFRGLEYMRYEAIIVPLQKLIALVAILYLYKLNINLKLLAPIALSLSLVPGLLFINCLVINFYQHKNIYYSVDLSYLQILKEGMVMGAASFLWIIYFRIDSVMLGAIGDRYKRGGKNSGGPDSIYRHAPLHPRYGVPGPRRFNSFDRVGIYTLAYKIMEAPIFFPSIIMMVVFPKLVKSDKFRQMFYSLLIILLILVILAFAIFYAGAYTFINLTYGVDFAESIDVLKILAFSLIPIYLGHLTTQSLVALDSSKTYLSIIFTGTITNITLNYYFIPRLGAAGAAYTTLLTELFVMLGCGILVLKITREC